MARYSGGFCRIFFISPRIIFSFILSSFEAADGRVGTRLLTGVNAFTNRW